MNDILSISSLIGDIYDTTLDRTLWPAVLKKTANYIQGESAAVYWNDVANKTGGVYLQDGGIDQHYQELYFNTYIKLNPTATRHYFADVGEPMATADLVPYSEFLETRFYREWAEPQGLVDFVGASLEKASTSTAMFGVFRHRRHGVVDQPTLARMRLLVPHIRRAVLIAKVVDLAKVEAAALAQTLDGLGAAIVLVDAGGSIVHANAAAHRLLADGDILRVSGSARLNLGTHQIDEDLQGIIAAAAMGDASLGSKGIAMPLVSRTGEHYVAHVLPLTSGLRSQSAFSHVAAAAVFVHRATIEAPSPPEIIAKSFKLTPSELRVLLAIVEVGGVPEVAEALGIAETTVKSHLGHVFTKTGTSRQVDLAKLVAGYASPLTG